jgi:Glycosyl transferase family 2
VRERIGDRRGWASGSARTAILVVNGFDRHSVSAFDVDEARRFPWIRIFLEQLERHTPAGSYDLLVWDNSFFPEQLELIAASERARVFSESKSGKDVRHGRALDRLLKQVPAETEYVVTLDTDSFPIRDGWLENVLGRLRDGASLVGVWRDEMAPEIRPYVHPSCLAARRETLVELGINFAREDGQDVGQNITAAVLADGGRISRLRRSNARNLHFLLAGVYGDLVYHHGAGSRHASFWTSDDAQADEAARIALRDAAFRDLETFVALLTGDAPVEAASELGLSPSLLPDPADATTV